LGTGACTMISPYSLDKLISDNSSSVPKNIKVGVIPNFFLYVKERLFQKS
jgi:hypothetical protein